MSEVTNRVQEIVYKVMAKQPLTDKEVDLLIEISVFNDKADILLSKDRLTKAQLKNATIAA